MRGKSLDGLLNEILVKSGCMYQSDLPIAQFRAEVLSAIRHMDAGDYETTAWRAAYKYISGADLDEVNAKSARIRLIEYLEG